MYKSKDIVSQSYTSCQILDPVINGPELYVNMLIKVSVECRPLLYETFDTLYTPFQTNTENGAL